MNGRQFKLVWALTKLVSKISKMIKKFVCGLVSIKIGEFCIMKYLIFVSSLKIIQIVFNKNYS